MGHILCTLSVDKKSLFGGGEGSGNRRRCAALVCVGNTTKMSHLLITLSTGYWMRKSRERVMAGPSRWDKTTEVLSLDAIRVHYLKSLGNKNNLIFLWMRKSKTLYCLAGKELDSVEQGQCYSLVGCQADVLNYIPILYSCGNYQCDGNSSC